MLVKSSPHDTLESSGRGGEDVRAAHRASATGDDVTRCMEHGQRRRNAAKTAVPKVGDNEVFRLRSESHVQRMPPVPRNGTFTAATEHRGSGRCWERILDS